MPSESRSPSAQIRRTLLQFAKLAALFPLIAATGTGNDAQSPSDHWEAVEAYVDATNTYQRKDAEIRRADDAEEEKERRRQDLGPAPDEASAIAAARAIMESNGEHALEAAEFLLDRFAPDHPENVQQFAFDFLTAHIGPDWSVVEDFVDSSAAIMAGFEGIRVDDATDEDKQRLRRLINRGPEPTTVHAVAAAMAIIDSNGTRALDAAEFLVEQTYDLRPTGAMAFSTWLSTTMQLGETALTELVGPNWQVVQDYLDQSKAWETAEREIRAAGTDEDEEAQRLERLGERPKVHRATAAAGAILDAGGTHNKTRLAAEFLLDNPTRGGAARGLRGAEALAAYFPNYDQWPLRLKQVNSMSNVHQPAKVFIQGLATGLEAHDARATARYFAASYLIQSVSQQWIPEADRIENQKRAVELATGLSAGIENETFILTKQDIDGTERPMTFADAEAELLYSLQATTVGGFVSNVKARRVDGTADNLSNYAGRVVLVDFWATWCGPCIAAFPKLRAMAAELPGEHFQIIGVNVDAELETAEDYLHDNPLPWVVWHVGDESEIVRKWRVTGFPTYVLIDPKGMILARNAGTFNDDFRATIEQAVGEFSPAAATP